MEKGWRRWNGEAWERVSLSDMVIYVLSTEKGQNLVKDHSLVDSWIDKARIEGMEDVDPLMKHQDLKEEREIFDIFRERIRLYRNGKLDINEFFGIKLDEDEKSNI